METTARRRLGQIASWPSLLSRHHIPTPPRPQLPTKSTKAKATKPIFDTSTLFRLCHQNTRKGNTGLLTIKKMNSEKQMGWLRLIHSLSTTKQLNKDEKSLCMALFIALRVVAGNTGALVAHAWGVTRQAIFRRHKQANTKNMDFTWKVRKDKGETVFTSNARRKATFTPQHAFYKIFRARNRGEPVSKSDLKKAWATASDEDIKNVSMLSEQFKQQAPFLQTEVQKVLKQTNGSVTRRELARQISGNCTETVCANTISDYITSLPGSSKHAIAL